MLSTPVPHSLPLDLWRKIAEKNPRAAASIACASHAMRDNVQDLTAIASGIAAHEMALNTDSADMHRAQAAKRDAFRAKHFFKVRDIPIVKELRDDVRAVYSGKESAGAVMWMPHAAVFPVLMPAKLVCRSIKAARQYSEAKAAIKQIRRRVPKDIDAVILGSSAWKASCVCTQGVQAGVGSDLVLAQL